jgi:hypothetical protein
MTMTSYVPSWEKKYDPWDREPEYWENEEIETETESDEIPLDLVDEKDLAIEFDESEFDLDAE